MNNDALTRLLFLLALAIAQPASAYQVSLDQFTVTRDGATFMDDPFDDGVPPPTATTFPNDSEATYRLHGEMGPESGGRLTLDTADAADGVIANSLAQVATLRTNIDESNSSSGLKPNHTFSATALFDLSEPEIPSEGYGVQLQDHLTAADDLSRARVGSSIRLLVKKTSSGDLVVQFMRLDFRTLERTRIATQDLELGHDQIRLTLSRDSTDANTVTASYAYVDGGVEQPTYTFSETAEIFQGDQFTRAGFLAFTKIAHGETQGDIEQLTLTAELRVSAGARGQTGNIYVAAVLEGNRIFFHDATGWRRWTSGAFPIYSTETLQDRTLQLLDNEDLSGIGGATLYVGYAITDSDLLEYKTYDTVYSQ